MAAIVTTNMRIFAAKQFASGFSGSPPENTYLFIGGTLPWDDDNSPPSPIDCEQDQSDAFLKMMSLKLINSTNVTLAAFRYSWQSGTIYSQYDNNIDLFDPSSGLPPFYVVSDGLNVYKCINNNNGSPSTIQPISTTTGVVTSADGYQWKYMFTINSADVLQFVTSEWIPVETLTANDGSLQWAVQEAAIPGTIDRIDIIASGTEYTQTPTVTIVGNGSGATAVATVSNGNIVNIQVTHTGSNYTWANVVITNGGVGSNGAVAQAVISPFSGHGADPVTELGAFFVLIAVQLIYDETGTFTVSNDYRQIGILQNPLLNDGETPATALDYSQALRLTFGTVSGTIFNPDETVTGNTSHATGSVMDWDSVNQILRLVQTTGAFLPGETVLGADATGTLESFSGTAVNGTSVTIVLPNTASSVDTTYNGQTISITTGTGSGQMRQVTAYVGVSRTATIAPPWTITPNSTSGFVLADIIPPDLEPFSGEIVYLENRRPITRAADQVESLRISIMF